MEKELGKFPHFRVIPGKMPMISMAWLGAWIFGCSPEGQAISIGCDGLGAMIVATRCSGQVWGLRSSPLGPNPGFLAEPSKIDPLGRAYRAVWRVPRSHYPPNSAVFGVPGDQTPKRQPHQGTGTPPHFSFGWPLPSGPAQRRPEALLGRSHRALPCRPHSDQAAVPDFQPLISRGRSVAEQPILSRART